MKFIKRWQFILLLLGMYVCVLLPQSLVAGQINYFSTPINDARIDFVSYSGAQFYANCPNSVQFTASGQWVKATAQAESGQYPFYRWNVGGTYYTDNPHTFYWNGTNYTVYAEYQQLSVPTAPSLIFPVQDATNVATAVTLDWSDCDSATMYGVQADEDGDWASVAIDATALNQSNYVAYFSPSSSYYYRARAGNAAGWSDWSTVWQFSTVKNGGENQILINVDNNINQAVEFAIFPPDISGNIKGTGATTLAYVKGCKVRLTAPLKFTADGTLFCCYGVKIDDVVYAELSREIIVDKNIQVTWLYSNDYDKLEKKFDGYIRIMQDFTPYTSPYAYQSLLEGMFGKQTINGYATSLPEDRVAKITENLTSIQDVQSATNFLQSATMAQEGVIKGFCGDLYLDPNTNYRGAVMYAEQITGYLAATFNSVAGCIINKIALGKQPPSWERDLALQLNQQALLSFMSVGEFFFNLVNSNEGKEVIGPAKFSALLATGYDLGKYDVDDMAVLIVDHLFNKYLARQILYPQYIPRSQFLVSRIRDAALPTVPYDERLTAASNAQWYMEGMADNCRDYYQTKEAIFSAIDMGLDFIELGSMAPGPAVLALVEANLLIPVRAMEAFDNAMLTIIARQRLFNIDTYNSRIIVSQLENIRAVIWGSFNGSEPFHGFMSTDKGLSKRDKVQSGKEIDFSLLDKQTAVLEKIYAFTSKAVDTTGLAAKLNILFQNSLAYATAIQSVLTKLDRVPVVDSLGEAEILAIRIAGSELIPANNALAAYFVRYYLTQTKGALDSANNALNQQIKATNNFKELFGVYMSDKEVAPVDFGFSAKTEFVGWAGDSVNYSVTLTVKNVSDQTSGTCTLSGHDDSYVISYDSIAVPALAGGDSIELFWDIKYPRGKIGLTISLGVSVQDSLVQTEYLYVPLPVPAEYSLRMTGQGDHGSSSVIFGRAPQASDGYGDDDWENPPFNPNRDNCEVSVYEEGLSQDSKYFIRTFKAAKYAYHTDAWWVRVKTYEPIELKFGYSGPDYNIAVFSTDKRFGGLNVESIMLPAGVDLLFLVSIGPQILLPVRVGWEFLSLPLPQDATSGQLFPTPSYNIRLYWYDPIEKCYQIIDNKTKVKDVFWALQKDSNMKYMILPQITEANQSLILGAGPSMVGTPGWSSINLADITVQYGETTLNFPDAVQAGWISPYIFGYDPEDNAYTVDNEMRVGCGYWFIVRQEEITIHFPNMSGSIKQKPQDEFAKLPYQLEMVNTNWQTSLKFINPNNKQGSKPSIIIGVKKGAVDDLDNYDVVTPPPVPNWETVVYLTTIPDMQLIQENRQAAEQVIFTGDLVIGSNFKGNTITIVPMINNLQEGNLSIAIMDTSCLISGDTLIIKGLSPGTYPFTITYNGTTNDCCGQQQADADTKVFYNQQINALIINSDRANGARDIRVTDILGRAMLQKTTNDNIVFLPMLSLGIYIAIVTDGSNSYIVKFIK